MTRMSGLVAASSTRVSAQTSRWGFVMAPPPRAPAPTRAAAASSAVAGRACHSERPSVNEIPRPFTVWARIAVGTSPPVPVRTSSQAARICPKSWPSISRTRQPNASKAPRRSMPAHGSRRLPRLRLALLERPAVLLHAVPVHDGREVAGTVARGDVDGLPDLALLGLAVAEHHEGVRRAARDDGCPWRGRGPRTSPAPASPSMRRSPAGGACPGGPAAGCRPCRTSAAPRPGSSRAWPSRCRGPRSCGPWTGRTGPAPASPARPAGSAARGSRARPAGPSPTAGRPRGPRRCARPSR